MAITSAPALFCSVGSQSFASSGDIIVGLFSLQILLLHIIGISAVCMEKSLQITRKEDMPFYLF
jgi:hypothetical protein